VKIGGKIGKKHCRIWTPYKLDPIFPAANDRAKFHKFDSELP